MVAWPGPNVTGEMIYKSDFDKLMKIWKDVKSGSGMIRIVEYDASGVKHAGFKAKIIDKIAKLMSKPVGRKLVSSLAAGGQLVTVRPSDAKIYGGANAIRGGAKTLEKADGSSGGGGTTIIQIDPNVSDTDIEVKDAAGNDISDPVFIILGHEMIHATHNQAGRNRRQLAATDNKYSNREEEQTVEGAGLTENALRAEHHLKARKGSSGKDARP